MKEVVSRNVHVKKHTVFGDGHDGHPSPALAVIVSAFGVRHWQFVGQSLGLLCCSLG